jgi:hypothetical protein
MTPTPEMLALPKSYTMTLDYRAPVVDAAGQPYLEELYMHTPQGWFHNGFRTHPAAWARVPKPMRAHFQLLTPTLAK